LPFINRAFCYLALSHDQQKITEQYKNIKAGFINSDIQIEGMAGERMLEAGCVQLWDKNLAFFAYPPYPLHEF
jgi:hypothetical protein